MFQYLCQDFLPRQNDKIFFPMASLEPGFSTKKSHAASTTHNLMDSKITKIASIILCHVEHIIKTCFRDMLHHKLFNTLIKT